MENKNTKLNWICGSDRMPNDFSKLYIIKYVHKTSYTDGFSFGSSETICKLKKIYENGYEFGTWGDTCDLNSDKTKILLRNFGKYAGTVSSCGFDMVKYLYWSEIKFDGCREKISSLENEKKTLEEKLVVVDAKLKEATIENSRECVSQTEFSEITEELKKKFEYLIEKTKNENKDKSLSFKFQEKFECIRGILNT